MVKLKVPCDGSLLVGGKVTEGLTGKSRRVTRLKDKLPTLILSAIHRTDRRKKEKKGENKKENASYTIKVTSHEREEREKNCKKKPKNINRVDIFHISSFQLWQHLLPSET